MDLVVFQFLIVYAVIISADNLWAQWRQRKVLRLHFLKRLQYQIPLISLFSCVASCAHGASTNFCVFKIQNDFPVVSHKNKPNFYAKTPKSKQTVIIFKSFKKVRQIIRAQKIKT